MVGARHKAQQRTIAVTLAVMVHAGLLVAFRIPPPPQIEGELVSDDQPGMSVSLVHLASIAKPVGHGDPEAASIEQLRLKLSGDQPAGPASPPPRDAARPDPGAVLEAFEERRLPASSQASARSASASASGQPNVLIEDPFAGASTPGSGTAARQNSAIWTRVAHCWRPKRADVQVILMLHLDQQGGLIEPPIVVRKASIKVDDARLEAEAEAVRAVVQCAPYPAAPGAAEAIELGAPPLSTRPG
jgi:hypothetical protein